MARRRARRRRRKSRTDIHSLVGVAALLMVAADVGLDPSGLSSSIDLPRSRSDDELLIASFNVKWVGYYAERDDDALARMLAIYDIVLVQEIVSPPYPGSFPDGNPYRPDPESREFFDAMTGQGFAHVLSPEDTGKRGKNQDNSSATEWFAAFYRPDAVTPASDLPGGFLAEDVTDHPEFARVPHAFPFRSVDGRLDFVLVSVHLTPDASAADVRRGELSAIARWISDHDQVENDFIVLGDMNIRDCDELAEVLPTGFRSLNDRCLATNTAQAVDPAKGRPYDHVLVPERDTEIDTAYGMRVNDLVEAMRQQWTDPAPYVGDPYDHAQFIKRYSDHHPIEFKMVKRSHDDD